MTEEVTPGVSDLLASDPWAVRCEEVARAVSEGEVSAVSVLEAALARIDATDESVGAFVETWRDRALEDASSVDQRRSAGEPLGPLAGVPVALKDNISLSGHALRCGSKILEGYVAPYTATAARRLLEADAVIVGRTNQDEFAMGSSCENSALQTTRNPWHLGMVPGGSSGGPAACVAASGVPLSLGSDTGGSIRQPAAFCGVVGVKPTWGRVSRYGLVAFASSLDQIGPIARSVRDAAIGLQVIVGADPHDATCSDQPVADYLATIEDGVEGLRIGVLAEADADSLGEAERASFRSGLAALESAGATLVEVSVPNVRAAVAAYYVVANSEASANLSRFDGVRYGHRAEGARSLDGLYSRSRSEGFGPEVKRRIMLGTFALSTGYYDAYYGQAVGVVRAMSKQFERSFQDVDIIATPTSPTGAFGLGEKSDDPLDMYLSDVYTTPASLAGLPAVAVPTGLDARGLPLSMQLMGRAFDEATLLRAARALELAVDFDRWPELKSG